MNEYDLVIDHMEKRRKERKRKRREKETKKEEFFEMIGFFSFPILCGMLMFI